MAKCGDAGHSGSMIDFDAPWHVSVADLLVNFRSALLSVLPNAEQGRLPWSDEQQHPQWEKLAECMFDVFVRQPIAADRSRWPGELPLPRYDIDYTDLAGRSWLKVSDGSADTLAFVRFLSVKAPFDSVQVRVVGKGDQTEERRVTEWPPSGVSYVRRAADGRAEQITVVEPVE